MKRWRLAARQHPDLLQHLCLLRGLTPEELQPDYTLNLHDPNLLPNMKEARALIVQAKKKGWYVVIFGDYDADGTPASALLSTALGRLGIAHEVILPTRQEGYGLKKTHVEALSKKAQLLITVDTGVTAVEEIALAKSKGLQIIVLDHHLPKEVLPPADALVDPFLETSTYPFANLCGCALAYKLVEALREDFPNELTEGFCKWLLDLVAISTVADMMQMTGENRALVHYGLQVLKKNRRPGLRALLEQAALDPATLTAGSMGYLIGPRLNASGRLKDNRPAFDLLMATDDSTARPLALEIEKANRERQRLVSETLEAAKKTLFKQNDQTDKCFVVSGENWPAGVLGLVAGKLASEWYRPVIVLGDYGDTLSGSARSVGDYSIIDGLTASSEWLSRFGGHRQAAGVGLNKKDQAKFVDSLKKHANKNISDEDLEPLLEVDALLKDSEITLETAKVCQTFEPFGLGNSQPLFVLPEVTLSEPKIIGSDKTHIRFKASKNTNDFEVIGFGLAKRATEEALSKADLVGHLEVNTWQNRERLQFRLVDFRAPGQPVEPTKKADRLAVS